MAARQPARVCTGKLEVQVPSIGFGIIPNFWGGVMQRFFWVFFFFFFRASVSKSKLVVLRHL